jgi:CMP-N-acetylneuraminic acid synthetase
MKPKIVALVPMRHHSERVPQKNLRDFNGKPLYYWILKTLCDSEMIDSVCVDTDSPVVKGQAPSINDKIKIIDRPKDLCADDVPMNEILLHDVSQVDADYYLQTHTTNPLLKRGTIERALNVFLNSKDKDSLFGVTRLQTRLWDKDHRPINHEIDKLVRTQDLPPVYEENSNIYIFTKKGLERERNRIGNHPILFEIPKEEALDIDEEIDFRMAEILCRLREEASV